MDLDRNRTLPHIVSVQLPMGFEPIAAKVEITAYNSLPGAPHRSVVLCGCITVVPGQGPSMVPDDEWSCYLAPTTARLPLHAGFAAPLPECSDDL